MQKQTETTPEYNGQCAFAVSLGKMGEQGALGRENCYLLDGDKKYLFLNPVAKFLWRLIPGSRKRADTNWFAQ
jgi:hypothetical protein